MSSTSTTQSNVKISQLNPLPLRDINSAYIAIPISKENDDKTWSSYRISSDHIFSYVNASLNNTNTISNINNTLTTLSSTLNTVSETADNAERVAYRAGSRADDAYTYAENAYARANNAYTYGHDALSRANDAYTYAGNAYAKANKAYTYAKNAESSAYNANESLTYISKSLAKYSSGFSHTYQLTKSSSTQYINVNGEVVTNNTYGFYIYDCDYQLQAGDLCSVYIGHQGLNDTYSGKISIVSKVHQKNNTYTYEPLPRQYYMYDDVHYVFFANEDMKVKFSLPNEAAVLSEGLTVYKYGAFKELGNAFLGVNSELMKVLVEAITKNRKDIESLYESIKSPGNISVSSIECDDFPSVQGEPMVVVKNRKPTYDSAYFGPEYPNRIGQIWVNTADGTAYIATKLGNGWKPITLGTAF